MFVANSPHYPGLSPSNNSSQRTFGATPSKGAPSSFAQHSLSVLQPVISCLFIMSLSAVVYRHFMIQAWLPVDSIIHPCSHQVPSLCTYCLFYLEACSSAHLPLRLLGWLYQPYEYFLTPYINSFSPKSAHQSSQHPGIQVKASCTEGRD